MVLPSAVEGDSQRRLVASQEAAMRTLVVFQPIEWLGAVDLHADPQLWLPGEGRPAGLDRWWIPLRLGNVTRTVLCDVGSPVTTGTTVWRRLAWSPVAEHGDALPIQRLLPRFDGEIGLSRDPSTLILHGRYDVPFGHVGEALDGLVLHRAARRTAMHLLGEIADRLTTAMPTGPSPSANSPGRARPVALVVDEDPDLVNVIGEGLRAEGYRVVTCPGPAAIDCAASGSGTRVTTRCPCVPAETELVVLGSHARRTLLPEAYASWLPDVEIRTATPNAPRASTPLAP